MDSTGAMIFRSAPTTPTIATTKESAVAMRGSLPSPYPFPSDRGTTRSEASAWSVRGAPRSDPIALDSDAAQIPSTIRMPHFATSRMIIMLVSRRSG